MRLLTKASALGVTCCMTAPSNRGDASAGIVNFEAPGNRKGTARTRPGGRPRTRPLRPRRRCTGTAPARKSDRAAPNGSRSKLVDVRSHDLSHSVASGGLLVGEGLPMIGKLQTTERYAYLANDPVKAVANRIASRVAEFAGLSATLRSAGACRSFSACEQGALGGLLLYLIVFSMKPRVLAFSINVRTLARSRPDGTSASISSFRVTSLPGRVVSCSTTASTI